MANYDFVIYALITMLLFGSMQLYFRIADKYNIIDKPNQRSSHSLITIRGGGVIFAFGSILTFAFYITEVYSSDFILLIGILMISIVSFWDDISSLPNRIRILIQLLAVTGLLYCANILLYLPIWIVVVSYVMVIGTINAYNFMDGINGITGVYSLSILLSCAYFLNITTLQLTTYEYHLLWITIISCLVFLFYNFRKKAKCFAGDVGSVAIGYIVLFFVLSIIVFTQDLKYIFFLALYGADAILTIGHRLLLKQNIFEAHRLHFYQILANDKKMPHLLVAMIYGVLQLIINLFILSTDFNFVQTGLMVCIPVAVVYIVFKPKWMKSLIV